MGFLVCFYIFFIFIFHFYFILFFTACLPFNTHLESTLEGVSTIRAFQTVDTVINEFHGCTDYQTEGHSMYIYNMKWFAQRINFIIVIFSICCIFGPVIFARFVGKLYLSSWFYFYKF